MKERAQDQRVPCFQHCWGFQHPTPASRPSHGGDGLEKNMSCLFDTELCWGEAGGTAPITVCYHHAAQGSQRQQVPEVHCPSNCCSSNSPFSECLRPERSPAFLSGKWGKASPETWLSTKKPDLEVECLGTPSQLLEAMNANQKVPWDLGDVVVNTVNLAGLRQSVAQAATGI